MKLRSAFKLLLSLFILSLLLSCNSRNETKEGKIITVSILPFKYFAGEIAGSDYKINVIVPPGASPATYEPPPSVIRSLQSSELVIFNGYLGFEQAWMDKLMQVNPDIKSLYLAESQELIAADEHQHGDHIHYEGVDPHFWMSPASARIIAEDIRVFLKDNYPEDSKIFDENYTQLVTRIDKVDTYAKQTLSALRNRSFLIFHPALTYLARDYNLTQIPIEFEGKEPSVAWLSEVIKTAQKDSIMTILVQREFNRKSAETIADEIGAEVIDIFPLSDDWLKSVNDVINAIGTMNQK